MPKKISTISAYSGADYLLTSTILVGGSSLITGLKSYPEITRKLGEPGEMRFELFRGSPWAAGRALQSRDRIRVIYDDASEEWWRVSDVKTITGGSGGTSVTCRPIWVDMGDTIFRYHLAPSRKISYSFPLYHLTVQEALNIIFSASNGINSIFALGTIETGLGTLEISVSTDGSATHLDLLRLVCEAAECEWEFAWDPNTATGTVNLYKEVGWSAAERTAGNADPDSRPIDAPTGGLVTSTGNRLQVSMHDDDGDYFSRVIPFGGPEESRVSIDDMWLTPVSTSYDVGADQTTIVLDSGIIYKDGIFVGKYIASFIGTDLISGQRLVTYHQILSSTKATDTVVVDGNAAGTDVLLSELVNGYYQAITYLNDPAAEAVKGRREIIVDFPEIPPYDNLFEKVASGSGDMSSWTGSYPDGIEPIGTLTTVAQKTDALNVRHGTSSLYFKGDVGTGVQTVEIYLTPIRPDLYHSVWVSGRCLAGRIRLTLVDSAGTVYPDPSGDEQAEFVADEILEIGIGGQNGGGFEPVSGNARIKLTILENATEFVLDALTITNSQSPWPYHPRMGKKGIFLEAADLLLLEGGVQPLAYESELFDVTHFDSNPAYAEITLGSHVHIRDLYDESSGTWIVDLTGRVIEIKEVESPTDGRVKKYIKIARNRPSVTSRLARTQVVPKGKEAPMTKKKIEYELCAIMGKELSCEGYGGIARFVWCTPVESNSEVFQALDANDLGDPLDEALRSIHDPDNYVYCHDQEVEILAIDAKHYFRVRSTTRDGRTLTSGIYVYCTGREVTKFVRNLTMYPGHSFFDWITLNALMSELETEINAVSYEYWQDLIVYGTIPATLTPVIITATAALSSAYVETA